MKLNNESSSNNENDIDKHDNGDDDIYNFDVKLNNFGDDYVNIYIYICSCCRININN